MGRRFVDGIEDVDGGGGFDEVRGVRLRDIWDGPRGVAGHGGETTGGA